MTQKTIQIRCKNNGTTLNVPMGSTLEEIFPQTGINMVHGPISVRVNNKVSIRGLIPDGTPIASRSRR